MSFDDGVKNSVLRAVPGRFVGRTIVANCAPAGGPLSCRARPFAFRTASLDKAKVRPAREFVELTTRGRSLADSVENLSTSRSPSHGVGPDDVRLAKNTRRAENDLERFEGKTGGNGGQTGGCTRCHLAPMFSTGRNIA